MLWALPLLVMGATTAAQQAESGVWPDSWHEVPRTVSQTEITTLSESPMSAELVKRGELPPVQHRLPDDPVVIEPLVDIGKYGGPGDQNRIAHHHGRWVQH